METNVVGAPTRCPECRSQDLVTTSKTIDTETYWRCRKCGEVWNDKRMREGARYSGFSYNRPTRR